MNQKQKFQQQAKLGMQAMGAKAGTGEALTARQQARAAYLQKQAGPSRGSAAGAAIDMVKQRVSPGVYRNMSPADASAYQQKPIAQAAAQVPRPTMGSRSDGWAPGQNVDPNRIPGGMGQGAGMPQQAPQRPNPYASAYNTETEQYNNGFNVGYNGNFARPQMPQQQQGGMSGVMGQLANAAGQAPQRPPMRPGYGQPWGPSGYSPNDRSSWNRR
jgi:hypothetical protein